MIVVAVGMAGAFRLGWDHAGERIMLGALFALGGLAILWLVLGCVTLLQRFADRSAKPS